MDLKAAVSFSKELLKGRRTAVMLICILPLLSELFFMTLEASIYSLLLYFGEMKPIALFNGENRIQLALTLVITVFRTVVTAPLTFAAAFRLRELCTEKRTKTPVSRILMSRRCFRRSLGLSLLSKLLGLIALLPAAFFGSCAYSMLRSADSPSELFMACHAAVLTAVSLAMWLSLKLSLYAAPYLMAHFPQKSPLRIIFCSIGFMRGKKHELLMLSAVYLPAALTLIGLPFAVTRVKTAFSLCISIHIKEEEYFEGNKTDSNGRFSDNAAKIPYGKARRFKKANYTAETS